jgi:hypothetical protein
MSVRIIADEILKLHALLNADRDAAWEPIIVDEIQHFITGRTNTGAINFKVPEDYCAVIVAIEQVNVDDTAAQTYTQTERGAVATKALVSQIGLGSDLFYVFGTGAAAITLTATAAAGKTYFARAIGYFLPSRALARLTHIGTKNLS